MDKAHKPSDTESSTPLSAPFPFRFYKLKTIFFLLYSMEGSRRLHPTAESMQFSYSGHTSSMTLFSLPSEAEGFRDITVVVTIIIMIIIIDTDGCAC
jgi:hypothetical protein